ncbi:MAG: hypothetical protein ACXVW6_05140 [Nocardioidaceae bacterium]
MRRGRVAAATAALGLLLGALAVGGAGEARAVTGTPVDLGTVSVSKQVARTHLNPDGTQTVADSRTVSLTVSQTTSLHSRQPVVVSWSGARPTAGLSTDPSSAEANLQEYPFVLVECRGVDSPTADPAQRLTPETCWTGSTRERVLQDRNTGFGPWRLDRYETPANRRQLVGVPTPLPGTCPAPDLAARWLHFREVRGTDDVDNGDGCGTVPPESAVVGNVNQPPNTLYAATGLDGTGSTKFTVWTSEDNASLGCGGGVPCALVAIPIEGISCDVSAKSLPPADRPAPSDVAALTKDCEATGHYTAGAIRIGGAPDRAVTGAMWFSESNWRNRITVPLDFAPLSNVCDITGGQPGVDVYGSELAAQLTSQWRPAFCLDKSRIPFKHVQVGEPQAANLLKAGNIDAALVSDTPSDGFGRPTVTAPVALTGFAISYAIDGPDKLPYHQLKLTPRLLAKLLTESYPGIVAVKDEYTALSHNPLDLSEDPEFKALNPQLTQAARDTASAATILNLSSDSDVVSALTRYIAADPEARSWLNGVPDPWGMVVNPNYSTNPLLKTGFSLPVDNWPLRDSFEPLKYYASGVNVCLQSDPVPIMPLLSSPTARLATISLAMQFANSSAQIYCSQVADQGSVGAKLVTAGRQTPGQRFVLGVTSLGDARRYALDTAALQTSVSPDAPYKLASAEGRSFSSPDDDGLRAAAKALALDPSSGTWRLPYDKVVSDPTDAAAYPGAMVVSLAVPTSGLDRTTANGLSQLLAFAAGAGQTPGIGLGQLPPGYLPMTAANGLGAERAATLAAAAAVEAQKGSAVPATSTPAPRPTPAPVAPGAATLPLPTAVGGGPVASGSRPFIGPVVPTATAPRGAPAPQVAAPVLAAPAQSLGLTSQVRSALAAGLFPMMLLLGLIGLSTAALIQRIGRQQPLP